jgi:hypothetical protein
MIYQQWAAVISAISHLFSQLVGSVFRHGAVYFLGGVYLAVA